MSMPACGGADEVPMPRDVVLLGVVPVPLFTPGDLAPAEVPIPELADPDAVEPLPPAPAPHCAKAGKLDIAKHPILVSIKPALAQRGNAAKALSELGWSASLSLEQIVQEMMDAGVARAKAQALRL